MDIRGKGLAASIALLGVTLAGCQGGERLAGVPDVVDFNWDVRPILSENCFGCHGFDASGREAGLRLDVPEAAFADLPESPGKRAIVPGDPEQSEIVRRIKASDPDVRMPPVESHKNALTAVQVAILEKWIDEGAEYKPHWAFISPEKPRVPRADFDDRAVNEVDRFVSAQLEQKGIAPSPEADKETLINRVSLSLTGLPPSLDEVDAFVADESDDAYEKLVDRLLASPAYGERMATYWMDLARWADTDGYLDDHHDRFLWPWRDWVIKSLNENMPFDQFSTWQLAGDLLPERSKEQLLATTFLRLSKRSTENGLIDAEYLNEYAVDRTEAVGNAFLGLTIGCARCHDHRYDPISHQDFYSFTGFFNNTDEPGFYPPGHSAIQAGPTLAWPSDEVAAQLQVAQADIVASQGSLNAAIEAARTSERVKSLAAVPSQYAAGAIEEALAASTVAHYPFEKTTPIPDRDINGLNRPRTTPPEELVVLRRQGGGGGGGGGGAQAQRTGPPPLRVPTGYVREQMVYSPSLVAAAKPAVLQSPILRDGPHGKALFFDELNKGFLGMDVGYYDRTQAFSFDLWFYPAENYPEKVPVLNHRDDDNSGGAGYRLELENQKLVFYMAHSRPYNMLAVRVIDELPLKEWSHLTVTYDGSSSVAGLKIYRNGREAKVDVIRDNLSLSVLPKSYSAIFDSFVGVAFGSRFREKSAIGSGLDEVRFFNKALTPIEVQYLQDGVQALSSNPEQVRGLLAEFAVASDPAVSAARETLTAAREKENQLLSRVPQVLVMGDNPTPRKTYRLDRGVYSEPKEEVPVQGLTQVYPWNPELPGNRVGLSQWLFDPKNPLTARVFVNRIWQMHFGHGLVETSEDFGSQGSKPTHPQLLDWLAVHFVESGWDLKDLHKLLVMSATYRQSSDAAEEAVKNDPLNQLLARGVRQRMPAEMVRDNALAAAGLLVNRVGGPSVLPYQPEGIWTPLVTFHTYPDAASLPTDEHHRRSLYTFVKRNAPHPGMQIFDFADRNVSTARRKVSNTPLQGLELMNDPQFVEAYRQLATHVMQKGGTTDEQLVNVFRLARRERPTSDQLTLLRDYLVQQEAEFAKAPDAAAELISTGVSAVDANLPPVRLAALTNVTAVVMNSPDAYSLR